MTAEHQQSSPRTRVWTVDAVRALGIFTDIVTAGSVLGLGRTTAYRLAREGGFPVTVVRFGGQYRIPVAELIKLIGPDL